MSMNEIRAMREKRVKLWEAAKAFVESRKDANAVSYTHLTLPTNSRV